MCIRDRGWVDLPVNYDKEEFARIKAAAEKICSDSDVLVVIGIGGSYPVSYTHLDVYKRQLVPGVRHHQRRGDRNL